MASFDLAVNIVLEQEKGYVNDPKDTGGETKYGISKKQYPQVDIKNLTPEGAKSIYQKDYWQAAYEQIQSQEIVNKVFSIGVDIGITHANVCLQRAVRATSGKCLIEDGLLGSISVLAINMCHPAILLAALKSELAGYYRMINNPHEINGWLNRAYK